MSEIKLTQAAIRLRRMAFYAYHGVLQQERAVGGEYWVDLTLYPDNISAAVQGDRLDGT
ncbi:MAG: dihydroneopterin aldolase, partial [Alloprevotella sp.]